MLSIAKPANCRNSPSSSSTADIKNIIGIYIRRNFLLPHSYHILDVRYLHRDGGYHMLYVRNIEAYIRASL